MSTQFPKRTHRAREIMSAVGRAYPDAWQQADNLRQMRGRELPEWADWCYLPVSGSYAIVSGGGERRVPFERVHHIGIVAALIAWRMTQGIYRYDPALYPALVDTPITGDIPDSVLCYLPEWCVYMETPDMEWQGRRLHGVWAHMEEEDNGTRELRLVLDAAVDVADPFDALSGCCTVPIILGGGGIVQSLQRLLASAKVQIAKAGAAVDPSRLNPDSYVAALAPIISLVLYLCSDAGDISGRNGSPGNPQPVKTRRHGMRLFPADGLRTWDVGVRIGAALRRAYQREEINAGATESGRSVRPHVRRAHWHTFVSGPRKDPNLQRRALKWLPPIPVGLEGYDDLPAVVRGVK